MRPLRRIRRIIKHLAGARFRERHTADRGYLVCSSPRCGSTYFCELLASTDVLGIPREYLNVGLGWGRLDQERATDLRPLFHRVLQAGVTPNGIYALKAHADHFTAIAGIVDPLLALPNLKFVRIRRQDTLGQAISWLRAWQTHQFALTDRQKYTPCYDAAGIRTFLALLTEQEATWKRLFAGMGCTPLEIDYDSLVQNPQRDVDRVARLMGLGHPAPIVPRRVKVTIQRDQLNAAWRSRFLAETGDEFGHLAIVTMPRSIPGSASAS
jgi:LPS sulfotransferase NodH